MNSRQLEIWIIDNGSSEFLNRTLDSLKVQTNQKFGYHVLDCTKFWTCNRNELEFGADYVMFVYAGSKLRENAVEKIFDVLSNTSPLWFYFDEETYRAAINQDPQGILQKPDFDPIWFAQVADLGEAVVFSRESLRGMHLQYEGSNFSVALMEMTVAAAICADGVHIHQCLMTRHVKCAPIEQEQILIADRLKQYLEARQLGLMGVQKGECLGLRVCPTKQSSEKLSMVVVSDEQVVPDYSPYRIFEDNVEIICETGDRPYWKKCADGSQRAHGDLICFLDAGCVPPPVDCLNRLLNYANLPGCELISPCLYHHDRFLYVGSYAYAGRLAVFPREEKTLSWLNEEITGVRQTLLPAWQCWMVKKSSMIQKIQQMTKRLDLSCLTKSQFLQEMAFQIKSTGGYSLYTGSVWVDCQETDYPQEEKEFCRMVFQRKSEYLMDPYMPVRMRAWLGEKELKGVKSYLPETMAPYSANAKKVLVISHELSLTGAPVVLAHAVRLLKQANWQIVVVSPVDGSMREEFLREGIPVLIMGDMDNNRDWLRCAHDFDLVLVNTIVPFRQVERLCKTNLPVMWWLHDAKSGYKAHLQYVLPETVSDNIHIYSVSQYADDVLKQYRPNYQSSLLLYGLQDEKDSMIASKPIGNRHVFVSIGTVIHRKGQDILAQAVRLLPDEVRDMCLFLFVGKCLDKDIMWHVTQLQHDYPETVTYLEMIPHDDVFPLYHSAAAVVCSSRDDPLPTFMAETMMVSGVCICSENTGTAAVIQHGVNGYVYHNDDPVELAKCICEVVACQDSRKIRAAARETFETVFSLDIFKQNLLKCVEESLERSGEKKNEREV